jgi:hypothetical protein
MSTDRKPVIDDTRVAEGLLFDDHGLRCRYLGKTSSEKPAWLEKHKGQFRRVEDVQRESAQPPDNTGAARTELNSKTSSPDTRKAGDRDDNSGCSPPCQPESVPAPVNENVPSGSTQTELPRSAEAATRETNGSETDTTPLEETGRNQGRGGGRRRKKRNSPAKVTNARDKFSPERMRVVLDNLSERPIQSYAAREAGIHRKTLENWIKRSKAGEDGYDIEHQDVTVRFHVHCEWSKEAAYDKILEAAYLIATGKAYTTDENGNLTLETVGPPNPKMMRFLLEWKYPDKYGKHPKVDVPQQGGVVLVGAPKKPKRTCPAASIKARSWKALSRKFREAKD